MHIPNFDNLKLITPPTSEIISLNDIKGHCRISSYNFADDVSWASTIAPSSYAIGSAAGTGVDISGCIPIMVIDSRTNGEGGTVIIKIQDSNDNLTFTDWHTFATITTGNDNTFYEKHYDGSKQYIRAYYTVAGATCSFGVNIMKRQPVASEDSWFTDLISIVREEAEEYTGLSFLTQTRELVLNRWPCKDYFLIPRPPLQSVSYIKYYGSDNTLYTFTTDDYIVGNTGNKYPGKVTLGYSEVWPSETLQTSEPIRVRYVSGYQSKADFLTFHRNIYNWMLIAIEKLYNNRDLSVSDVPHNALNRDKVEWL